MGSESKGDALGNINPDSLDRYTWFTVKVNKNEGTETHKAQIIL